MFKSIAIDGPAGAGKSYISDIISQKLNFLHVDTGAMYRTVAIYFYDNKIDFSNESLVSEKINQISIDVKFIDSKQVMILNSIDVSDRLRSREISDISLKISPFKSVRDFLLSLQRQLALNHNVVMDGRDIASVVLPNADVKIFLTASVEERARRRFEQIREKGQDCDYNQILDSIKIRDHSDFTRENAPLVISKDAIFCDSTYKTVDQVVEFLMNKIKKVI